VAWAHAVAGFIADSHALGAVYTGRAQVIVSQTHQQELSLHSGMLQAIVEDARKINSLYSI